MSRYILKRLLQMIPVLIAVAILIFTLMYFVPGDPAQILMGEGHATPEQLEAIREQLGLNKSFWGQMIDYLAGILRLDFGNSYTFGTSVGLQLMQRFPITLTLALCSLLFVVLIGVPLGVISALKAGKFLDKFLMGFTLLFNSMPGFWLGLLLIVLFSVILDWLPSNGIGGPQYFIMPIIASSIGALAGLTRLTRSSMLEVVRSDFVTTARAKGLKERTVIYGHALPNALIPIITVCGARFGFMLGGTAITETIYSLPGIGQYLIAAINSRDYPVVRGSILYIAVTFSVIMLIVDLLYAVADPRIRAQYAKAKRKRERPNSSATSA